MDLAHARPGRPQVQDATWRFPPVATSTTETNILRVPRGHVPEGTNAWLIETEAGSAGVWLRVYMGDRPSPYLERHVDAGTSGLYCIADVDGAVRVTLQADSGTPNANGSLRPLPWQVSVADPGAEVGSDTTAANTAFSNQAIGVGIPFDHNKLAFLVSLSGGSTDFTPKLDIGGTVFIMASTVAGITAATIYEYDVPSTRTSRIATVDTTAAGIGETVTVTCMSWYEGR